MSKNRNLKVPLQTEELRLNCSIHSNPLGSIKWYFLWNKKSKEGLNIIDTKNKNRYNLYESSTVSAPLSSDESSHQWLQLNEIASYSVRNYGKDKLDTNFPKLALSKYQIHDRILYHNRIQSMLVIQVSFSFFFELIIVLKIYPFIL
jgi:hypothetical protein